MEAETLLNHSMLVLSPFESSDCKAIPSAAKAFPKGFDGKETGIHAAKGKFVPYVSLSFVPYVSLSLVGIYKPDLMEIPHFF